MVLLVMMMMIGWVRGDIYNLWQQSDKVSPDIQERAFAGLVDRLLGETNITVEVEVGLARGAGGVDRVLLNYQDPVLRIHSTTAVAAAWGFHHFLKYSCMSHVSWDSQCVDTARCRDNVDLVLEANDLYRYYQNVCTPGYSFVWWTWKDWEKHIDWMALNGINLSLAFTGQEEIWRRVWIKLGLSQKDLDAHFAGPAFLPWGRMGNLRGWGGPLTASWHKHQLQLQHQILERMRDFGMIPVLPGFSGQVPDGFVTMHPRSNFSRQIWNNFGSTYSGVYLLHPEDPLFQDIGTLFIQEQTKEYGSNHIYNCDTFNEMRPPSNSTEYLNMVLVFSHY